MKKNVAGNIKKLYLVKFSKWFMLVIPVMAMFYEENGCGPTALFILQGVYAVSTSLLEIPSGYLADVWGRKNTLVLGSILGTAGYIIYAISHGFLGFLIAEFIMGIGVSFISGSDSAILYDSLAKMKKEKEYLKYEGRITSLGSFFETGASLFGGLTAGFLFLRAPFIAQVFVAAIAIPASITLFEPQRFSKPGKGAFKNIMAIVKESLVKNKVLRSNLLFSSVIGCATLTMAWSIQIFGTYNNFDEFKITVLWVTLNLIVAFSAFYAHKFLETMNHKLIFAIIGIYIPVTYLLTGFLNLYAIPVFFVFYLVRGIATPSLKERINHLTSSKVRATVLSVRSLAIRLLFIIVGTVIGYITNQYDFLTAMKIIGGLFLLMSAITGIPFFSHLSKSPNILKAQQ